MRSLLLISVAMMTAVVAYAQTPLVKIGNVKHTLEEFDYIYEKNASNSQLPISKEEYLDLYINYKLKVAEAMRLQLDTAAQFVEEIGAIEADLAAPYLEDTAAVTTYKETLKARLDEEINASHILISVAVDATPAEVDEAYGKAKAARDMVMSGEDFNVVASRVSEDPSARVNGGRLGYFSALRMVTEFEDMAYATPVGEVTDIFRTQFGWHFMKVHDRRPYSGKIQVLHIMKMLQRGAKPEDVEKARQQIDSIYGCIKAGEDFVDLARRLSDDRQSAQMNGLMPWFGMNDIVAPFGEKAFALANDGDVSEPFATRFGWHIVKRVALKTKMDDAEKENMITQLIRSGQHPISNAATTSKVEQLKTAYAFTLNERMVDEVMVIMASKEPDSVKENSLKVLPEPLATYNGGSVNALAAMRVWRNDILPEQNFNALAKEELFKAESRRIAQSDETYKYTLQEYKDGFMVFEINQRYIWQDTKEDTTALVTLYEQNKARYSKGGTFEGDIYFFKTKKDRKKAKQNPALAAKLAYKVVSGKQEQGGLYDDLIWSLGEHDYVIVTGKRTDGEVQPYEKVKGRLIADYHQQKEKEYVMQLRKRFNPKVVGKIK